MQTGGNIKSPSFLLFCCYFLVFLVAWSLPNISANHLFERLVTANIIFNLFTSFFAIHYYKISKYACKSTIIISEKRTIASKCLRLVSLIDRNLYFGVTSSVLLGHHCRFSGAQKCSFPSANVPLPQHNSAPP